MRLPPPWTRTTGRRRATAATSASTWLWSAMVVPPSLTTRTLAHVVYSEFSMTYASVRSQPNASPLPVAQTEVQRDDDLGRRPSRHGPRRDRRRPGRRRRRRTRGGRRSRSGASRDRARPGCRHGPSRPPRTGRPPRGRPRSASRALPAAPAIRPQFGSRPWAAALTRLDETTARATARASASSRAPGHRGRDERAGPLAVGRLLAREVARDRLDGGAEDAGGRRAGPRPARPPTPRTRGRRRCRSCSCRRRPRAGPRSAPRPAGAWPTAPRARRSRRSARPTASSPSAGGSSRRPWRRR